MKIGLCIYTFILFIGSLHSQVYNCGNDLIVKKEDKVEEENYRRAVGKNNTRFFDPITLPIVVHIIHNNGPENISDAQINQGIAWLNAAFSNQNPYYNESGEDSQISFCLATRKPDGGATNGINRVFSSLTNYNFVGFDKDLKSLSWWPTKEYINIWLVKDVSMYGNQNYTGYAFQPIVAESEVDGIVMEAALFGNTKVQTTTLIHEMGHYLGLDHTFFNGCKNLDCLVDGDKVCDTPPDGTNFAVTCNGITKYNSCRSDEDDLSLNNPFRPKALGGLGDQPDLEDNFMDYGFSNCAGQFTQGQINRIRYFLGVMRKRLVNSKGCTPPCPKIVKTDFSINKITFEAGEQIVINNTSINASDYFWYLNNNLISNLKIPDLVELKTGINTLKLVAKSSIPSCDSDSLSIDLTITCKVKAEMDFKAKDSLIYFDNKSINENSVTYKIIDKIGTIVYSKSTNKDSLKLLPNNYTICLIANSNYCNDTICKAFQILPLGVEQCYNTIDDDQDGFIDLFDKDCACEDSIYNAGCHSICEYVTNEFSKIKFKLKWRTDVIDIENGNFTQFAVGRNEIITPITTGKLFYTKHGIKIYDSFTGTLKKAFHTDSVFVGFPCIKHILVLDSDYDGVLELIFKNNEGGLLCYDESGKAIWSSKVYKYFEEQTYPQSSDFNNDGNPEVYFGNKIINSKTGKLLIDGKLSYGCLQHPFQYFGYGAHSIAADLTSHEGLELAAGNVVYEIEINNIGDSIGNKVNVIYAPPPVLEGATVVADINLDGLQDVIVNKGSNLFSSGGIWIWDPRTKQIIASIEYPIQVNVNFEASMNGGVPFIGNIDNDCFPEIGVTYINELRMYKYDGTSSLNLMYSIPTTDRSGITGITMFDFNQDGKNELVYRDETFLRIIEGATGRTIDSFEIHSATGAEYPIIADIDDDGQAEILVNGFLPSEPDSLRIFSFESTGDPWAPARKVWNQTGYHITNVNDDLTIPRQEQNNAAFFDTDSCAQQTCNQPYNTFMCQATYRDQNGCVKWPAVDMMADILDYSCLGDSVTLMIEVRNQSNNAFKQDSVNLALYSNADNLPFVLRQLSWDKTKKTDTISITLSNIGLSKVKARVNIPDGNTSFASNIKGLTPVLECDYDNNSDSLSLDLAKKTLDLGPDITKCRTQVFTLHAGNDFDSYFWSDGSQDSTYTTSNAGIHKVIAYDKCNRKYEDEVMFNVNNALIPFLADIEKCEDDTFNIQVTAGFKLVQWFPSNNVLCDTCDNTKIVSDSSFNLIMVTSKNGCIDADTAMVSIKPLQRKTINSSVCEGTIFNFYNNILITSGQYTHKTGQCDSLITLNLKINPRDNTYLSKQICKGDSIQIFDKYYHQSINATFKGTNQYGCDSIVNVNLMVIDTIRASKSIAICNGDSIKINNQWINQSGKFDFYYQSSHGCDSVATYQVSLLPIFIDQLSYTICKDSSIKVGTEVYDKAGIYTQQWKSSQGCDSTLSISISIIPSTVFKDTISICEGDSIRVFEKFEKVSGTFNQSFLAANGCDSTAIITLIIKPVLSNFDSISFCEGDSVLIFGKYYNKIGTYQQTYSSSQGCDSTSTIKLKVAPIIRNVNMVKLCEGDTVFIGGKAITQGGMVFDTTYINGNCKKITTHDIEIVNAIIKTTSFVICPEDSISINGKYYNESGTYIINLPSIVNCDTLLTANITKLSWPGKPFIIVDCDKQSYTASMVASEPWIYTWPDGSTSLTYTFNATNALDLKTTTTSGCEKNYSILLPTIPKPTDIPQLGDQSTTSGKDIVLTIPLDREEWKIQWKPSNLIGCDTCLTTSISTDRDTTIEIELQHESGCVFLQTFRIVVEDNSIINIPNIFYPKSVNGNNIWKINVPNGYSIIELNVYDRWADKVFTAINTSSAEWDGTFNGKELVEGVYVFTVKMIDNKSNVIFKVGDVTLLR